MNQTALHDPLQYPFDVRRTGFIVDNGLIVVDDIPILEDIDLRHIDWRSHNDFSFHKDKNFGISDPIAYLTCGSNASATRLTEKLLKCPIPSAYALRIRMPSWVPTYAATMSFYGAIPATFEYNESQAAEQFLIVTDSANRKELTASEQRTGNYDVYTVPPEATEIKISCPLLAFVCRFGAIRIDGLSFHLQEFQPDPHNGVDQAYILDFVLSHVAPGMTREEFRRQLSKNAFFQDIRYRIIEKFGTKPNLPGWEVASL